MCALGFCAYSGYETYQRGKAKVFSTAENLERWRARKYEYLEAKVCQSLNSELDEFARNGTLCRSNLSNLIEVHKKYSVTPNDPWFDAVGIPEEYRSMDDIRITPDELRCGEKILDKWKLCPKY